MKVIFIMRDGSKRELGATIGQSILEVAKQHNIHEIEGACGGVMACATCHVIVSPGWYEKLPSKTTDEDDMLDLAPNLTKTSRLGCQIRLTGQLDGLEIKLP